MKVYLVVLIACFLLGGSLGVELIISPILYCQHIAKMLLSASPIPSKGIPTPAIAHHKRAAPSIIDAVAAAPKAAPTPAHKLAKRGGYG
ncbi:hypothetical protein PRIPAC_82975 [Pristionchus pacificus]|nr:hypothetical protein PRIPAC_82975 [Pristionchus pacificus]|eukprot:PDM78808.1 hypothetical protein PRIPAC_31387 [Pristionchus pacificus]